MSTDEETNAASRLQEEMSRDDEPPTSAGVGTRLRHKRYSSPDYQLEPVTDDDDEDDDDLYEGDSETNGIADADRSPPYYSAFDELPNTGQQTTRGQPPTEGAKRKRRITKDQRLAANKRERKRMLSLNTAFERLKKSVPVFPHERKLSRIQTLRLAMSYISFMSDLLWETPSPGQVAGAPPPHTAVPPAVPYHHHQPTSQPLPPIHFGMACSHHPHHDHPHSHPHHQSHRQHSHSQHIQIASAMTGARRGDVNMYLGY
ncbi:uncharacterized protein LOC141912136 [Tubulanus polymorphus]|uniref:uncharacterized protein LOC141912136 n=1 Tax=Tubulanus polymorphus TaxID=672921 RepID=UPI003DA1EC84